MPADKKSQEAQFGVKNSEKAVKAVKSPRYIDYLTIQRWDGKMPLALGSGSLLSITGEQR